MVTRAGRVVRVGGGTPPPAPVPHRRQPRRSPLAGLTGSALLASVVAVAGGAVGSEYVGSAVLSFVVPALVGAGCGFGATRGGVLGGGAVARSVTLAVAAGYAALSAALAFRFATTDFGPVGEWLPPVLAGMAGALAWPLLDPRPPALSR